MCINIIKRINIQRNVLRPFHLTLNVVSQCEKLWTMRGVKKKQQRTGSPFDSITRTAEALYAICLFYNWKIFADGMQITRCVFSIYVVHMRILFSAYRFNWKSRVKKLCKCLKREPQVGMTSIESTVLHIALLSIIDCPLSCPQTCGRKLIFRYVLIYEKVLWTIRSTKHINFLDKPVR